MWFSSSIASTATPNCGSRCFAVALFHSDEVELCQGLQVSGLGQHEHFLHDEVNLFLRQVPGSCPEFRRMKPDAMLSHGGGCDQGGPPFELAGSMIIRLVFLLYLH